MSFNFYAVSTQNVNHENIIKGLIKEIETYFGEGSYIKIRDVNNEYDRVRIRCDVNEDDFEEVNRIIKDFFQKK
ncbi:MAG: hypothetical protein NUV92_08530 [Ignavibacteria bacterium]|jgi:hypothetical protein|nr:hypothetical protein [Ignavibacteria bacterium]MDH7527830.1 hypothetical protein [Ignavibacteria bacterium]